jgi:hypothetical protein
MPKFKLATSDTLGLVVWGDKFGSSRGIFNGAIVTLLGAPKNNDESTHRRVRLECGFEGDVRWECFESK